MKEEEKKEETNMEEKYAEIEYKDGKFVLVEGGEEAPEGTYIIKIVKSDNAETSDLAEDGKDKNDEEEKAEMQKLVQELKVKVEKLETERANLSKLVEETNKKAVDIKLSAIKTEPEKEVIEKVDFSKMTPLQRELHQIKNIGKSLNK